MELRFGAVNVSFENDLGFFLQSNRYAFMDYTSMKGVHIIKTGSINSEWDNNGWKTDVSRANGVAINDIFRYAVYLLGSELNSKMSDFQKIKSDYNDFAGRLNDHLDSEHNRVVYINESIENKDSYFSNFLEDAVPADVYTGDYDVNCLNNHNEGCYSKFISALKEVEKICTMYADNKTLVAERAARYESELGGLTEKLISNAVNILTKDYLRPLHYLRDTLKSIFEREYFFPKFRFKSKDFKMIKRKTGIIDYLFFVVCNEPVCGNCIFEFDGNRVVYRDKQGSIFNWLEFSRRDAPKAFSILKEASDEALKKAEYFKSLSVKDKMIFYKKEKEAERQEIFRREASEKAKKMAYENYINSTGEAKRILGSILDKDSVSDKPRSIDLADYLSEAWDFFLKAIIYIGLGLGVAAGLIAWLATGWFPSFLIAVAGGLILSYLFCFVFDVIIPSFSDAWYNFTNFVAPWSCGILAGAGLVFGIIGDIISLFGKSKDSIGTMIAMPFALAAFGAIAGVIIGVIIGFIIGCVKGIKYSRYK